MMTRSRQFRRRGFSLMECLMIILILGIVGGAAGQMLTALAKTPRDTETQFQIDAALVSKLEYLRSLTFDQLTLCGPTGMPLDPPMSDYVVINNKSYARSVYITNVDANGDGVIDVNIKQIKVQIGGQYLTTLVNQP
jgi:hypothetical protein